MLSVKLSDRKYWHVVVSLGVFFSTVDRARSQQQVSQIPETWIVWSADLVPVEGSQSFSAAFGGYGWVWDAFDPPGFGCFRDSTENGRNSAAGNATASCAGGMAGAHGAIITGAVGGEGYGGKLVQLNGSSIGMLNAQVRNKRIGEAGVGHAYTGATSYRIVCPDRDDPYDALIAQVIVATVTHSADLIGGWANGDAAKVTVGGAGFYFTDGAWDGGWTQFNPNTFQMDEFVFLDSPSGIVAIHNFFVSCGQIIHANYWSDFADAVIVSNSPGERRGGNEHNSIAVAISVHAVKYP